MRPEPELGDDPLRLADVAIACGEAKIPSLFFDKVVPLSLKGDVPVDIAIEGADEDRLLSVATQQLIVLKGKDELLKDQRDGVAMIQNLWALHIHAAFQKRGIATVPFYDHSPGFDVLLGKGSSPAVEVTISNIPIIAQASLKWEQVRELRRDTSSRVHLRRFRLLLAENYAGKDPTYIRESIQKRIDDYESACKKHGLQLVTATLSKLLDSKSLLGTLGLSTLSVLLGHRGLATATMLTGASLEIGKAALTVIERMLEFRSWAENAEIAYLMDIARK